MTVDIKNGTSYFYLTFNWDPKIMWVNYSHLPQSNIRRYTAICTEEERETISATCSLRLAMSACRGSAVPWGRCDASPHWGGHKWLEQVPPKTGSQKLESDTLVSNVRVVAEPHQTWRKVCVLGQGHGLPLSPPPEGEPAWAIKNLGNDFLDLRHPCGD